MYQKNLYFCREKKRLLFIKNIAYPQKCNKNYGWLRESNSLLAGFLTALPHYISAMYACNESLAISGKGKKSEWWIEYFPFDFFSTEKLFIGAISISMKTNNCQKSLAHTVKKKLSQFQQFDFDYWVTLFGSNNSKSVSVFYRDNWRKNCNKELPYLKRNSIEKWTPKDGETGNIFWPI